MQITIDIEIDERLYREALELADPDMDPADLFQHALKLFISLRKHHRLQLLSRRAGSAALPDS